MSPGFATGLLLGLVGGVMVGYSLARILDQTVERFRMWNFDRRLLFAGVAIAILAITNGITLYNVFEVAPARDRQDVACNRDYQQKREEAARPRTEALEQNDAAVDKVIRTSARLFEPDAGPADLDKARTAFAGYLQTKAELDKARAENPYPAAPDKFCEGR